MKRRARLRFFCLSNLGDLIGGFRYAQRKRKHFPNPKVGFFVIPDMEPERENNLNRIFSREIPMPLKGNPRKVSRTSPLARIRRVLRRSR